jgi:IS30 family transposase
MTRRCGVTWRRTLRLRWSPQQISRRLIIDHRHDGLMRMSHETICTSLFVQTKAVLHIAYEADFASANQARPPPSAATSPATDAIEVNP